MANSPPHSIRVDYDKLGARLGISLGEVHAWLISKGFKPAGGHWHANGQLALLRPEEILERRHRQTDGPVTFIDTLPGSPDQRD
jgi:hypothetical protein